MVTRMTVDSPVVHYDVYEHSLNLYELFLLTGVHIKAELSSDSPGKGQMPDLTGRHSQNGNPTEKLNSQGKCIEIEDNYSHPHHDDAFGTPTSSSAFPPMARWHASNSLACLFMETNSYPGYAYDFSHKINHLTEELPARFAQEYQTRSRSSTQLQQTKKRAI